MKMNKLSAVVAAASLAVAGSASALTIADLPADVQIDVSGASASDKTFQGVFNTLCVDTPVVFTDRCDDENVESDLSTCVDTGSKLPGKSYAGYFCTMDASTVSGLSGSTTVLLRKRSTGGSFWGTVPVANADGIDFMEINSSNCNAVPGESDVYKCDKNTVETAVPDAGISDEEPELFTSLNVATGATPMDANLRANLNVEPINALTFGVPVTNALFAALQEAQGLTVGGPLPANMPSLSKEQVAALISGSINNWSDVQYGGVPLTTLATTPPTADSRVAICRRVNGSGTQAQMNANFLHAPCTSAASFPSTDNTPCTGTKGENPSPGFCSDGYAALEFANGANVVHENSGSGDVTQCLDDLQDANRWAIGVQSLEKASDKWQFIKVNGFAPTLENVAEGKYFDWAASTVQWRNKVVNGEPVPTAAQLAILSSIREEAGQPSVLDGINDGTDQGFGATGALALGTLPGVTLSPFNADLPVMQYSRNGKTCSVQRALGTVDFE
ncbi:MAG: hypothetical protein MI867_21220 [Pseudomonadales bacterium]|nr:hypothetical protein [Pseudomonadales bacterium]